jgi:hypothetical protein
MILTSQKLNNIFLPVLLLGALLLFGYGCQPDNASQEATNTPASSTTLQVPAFDRDSALVYLTRQVEFGPRTPNTPAHRACGEWLGDKLRSFGAAVIEQKFDAKAYTGETLNGTNIIAQFNPDQSNRILLAAHWDTRHIADSPLSTEGRNQPILGADDGASGVAVLLEIARQLQANPVDIGVDIILFDLEDYGETEEKDQAGENSSWCLGSQYWSRNKHRNGYQPKYGILLDMVGARGARFPKEYYSMQFAPQLVNQIWRLANRMGYGNYFHDANGGGVTDDHYFVSTIGRIPMIDIINLPLNSNNKGFGEHWHTQNDNLDVIDKRTLRAVGQVLLAVIYREAGGTL